MRRVIVSACVMAVVGVYSVAARGQLLVYEPFSYDPTGNPELSTVGSPDWQRINNNSTPAPSVRAGNLSYGGTLVTPPVGNHVRIGGIVGETSSATRLLPGGPYHVSTNPTVYWSTLMRIDSLMGLDFNVDGGFFAGLRSVSGTSLIQNAQVGAPLVVNSANAERSKYKIGTGRTATAGQRVFDTTEYSPGETLFLVFAYQLHSGNNVARMWVNPDPFQSEAQNSSALKVEVNTGTTISGGQFTNVFLRNNQSGPDDGIFLDELRVALSWESVVGLQEGDFNRDGVVDTVDRGILYGGFGQGLSGYENGDMNRNGVVELDDIALFDRAFALGGGGASGPMLTAVPEPGVGMGFGLMLGAMVRRRK